MLLLREKYESQKYARDAALILKDNLIAPGAAILQKCRLFCRIAVLFFRYTKIANPTKMYEIHFCSASFKETRSLSGLSLWFF